MSAGMAKATLIGNLCADPEKKSGDGKKTMATFRLACNKGKDRVEFVNVVCFEKTAESVLEYKKKGDSLYVEGDIQTREWTDKDGQKRWSTEVVGWQVLFIGGARGEEKPSSRAAPF